MISYDQALELVLGFGDPLDVRQVALLDAQGRVLGEDLRSPFPLPRFDNSAVDGYALGFPLGDERWTVVRTIAAGEGSGPELRPGECARIFTGAPIPSKCIAIVMQEDVEVCEMTICVQGGIKPGQNIRREGEELEANAIALHCGTLIQAAGIGVAATLGLATLPIHPAPQVGILVTGTELASPGSSLCEGQIYESNSVMLSAALREMDVTAEFTEIIGDDPVKTEDSLRTALQRCDVLITTGGVSVGERDVVKTALERLGVEQVFWKAAIKPGKPVYMGRLKSRTIFGLPGNPLSVLTMFTMLVKPFLRSVMGFPAPAPARISATLASTVQHKLGRREFMPGLLTQDSEGPTISPISGQGSHMLCGMARANAFLDIPSDVAELQQGQLVSAVLL